MSSFSSGDGSDDATIDNVVKANLSKIRCALCLGQPIRTNGASVGRLRLYCECCKKTFYANRVLEQLKTLNLLPLTNDSTKNSIQYERNKKPVTLTTLSQKSMPQRETQVATPQKTLSSLSQPEPLPRSNPKKITTKVTNSSDDSTDLSSTDDEAFDAGGHNRGDVAMKDTQDIQMQEDPVADMIESLWDFKHEATQRMVKYEKNMNKMEKMLGEIAATIERLYAQQQALLHASTERSEDRGNVSQQNNKLTPAPQIQPGQQTYASIVTNLATRADGEPWQLVTGRRGSRTQLNEGPTRMAHSDESGSERNHYDALRQAIPSMQRSMERRDTAIATNNGGNRIRKLSEEEMTRIANGRPRIASSPMVILYFRGLKRNRICDIKSYLLTIGIRLGSVRNISFVGKSIMELITFEDAKDDIILKLAERNVTLDKYFDPLATDNVKNPTYQQDSMSEDEKRMLAERLYRNRIEAQIRRIPLEARQNRLRNFLASRVAAAPYEIMRTFENRTSPTPLGRTQNEGTRIAVTTPLSELEEGELQEERYITSAEASMDVQRTDTQENNKSEKRRRIDNMDNQQESSCHTSNHD